MKKVLIATLYHADSVLLAVTRLGVDRVVLLINNKQDKTLKDSLVLVQKTIVKHVPVKIIKTPNYDIVQTATVVVKEIDNKAKDEEIYVNITSGRKTKAIGLLFGAYARHDYVKKISYYPEEQEEKEVVYLPRLSFKLTKSEKLILSVLDKGNYKKMKELSKKVKLSTAMLYRAIDDLKDRDFVVDDGEIKITDAGRIARL